MLFIQENYLEREERKERKQVWRWPQDSVDGRDSGSGLAKRKVTLVVGILLLPGVTAGDCRR